jgi:hypothetical protein
MTPKRTLSSGGQRRARASSLLPFPRDAVCETFECTDGLAGWRAGGLAGWLADGRAGRCVHVTVLLRRMETYESETLPVIEHFRRLGRLHEVHATARNALRHDGGRPVTNAPWRLRSCGRHENPCRSVHTGRWHNHRSHGPEAVTSQNKATGVFSSNNQAQCRPCQCLVRVHPRKPCAECHASPALRHVSCPGRCGRSGGQRSRTAGVSAIGLPFMAEAPALRVHTSS